MPITEEEANQVKEHLLKQLDNFPEDKRSQIESQINSMTTEQVETFVKQNNLTHLGGQCIFCAIAENKSPSHKILEEKDNLAILEINPQSKGHTLVLPKEHVQEILNSTKLMAESVASKLKKNLGANSVEINELKIMDHALLEVVPKYEGEKKKRRSASEEELKDIQEKILSPPKVKVEKETKKEIIPEKIPILPPRIP